MAKRKKDFFSGIEQRPFKIRGNDAKSPMFFRDLSIMGAVFPVPLSTLKRLITPKRLKPSRLFPGMGLVAVHCMEYRDTDVGPYNEVSLSIAAQRKPFLFSPLALARSTLIRNVHTYVKELPVNTDVAVAGGVDLFGYPKYLASISFRETQLHRICTIHDAETHELIFEFEIHKFQTKKSSMQLTMHTYSQKEKALLHSKMQVGMLESGVSFLPSRVDFRFGKHERAQSFEKVFAKNFSRIPLCSMLIPKAQAILWEPEEIK